MFVCQYMIGKVFVWKFLYFIFHKICKILLISVCSYFICRYLNEVIKIRSTHQWHVSLVLKMAGAHQVPPMDKESPTLSPFLYVVNTKYPVDDYRQRRTRRDSLVNQLTMDLQVANAGTKKISCTIFSSLRRRFSNKHEKIHCFSSNLCLGITTNNCHHVL